MACKTCKKKDTNVTKSIPNIVIPSAEDIKDTVPLIPVYSMSLQDKIDMEIGIILVLYSEYNTGYDYKYLIIRHLVNIFKHKELYKREVYKQFITPFMTDNYLNIQRLLQHFYEM
jgi:hypothetical protein